MLTMWLHKVNFFFLISDNSKIKVGEHLLCSLKATKCKQIIKQMHMSFKQICGLFNATDEHL